MLRTPREIVFHLFTTIPQDVALCFRVAEVPIGEENALLSKDLSLADLADQAFQQTRQWIVFKKLLRNRLIDLCFSRAGEEILTISGWRHLSPDTNDGPLNFVWGQENHQSWGLLVTTFSVKFVSSNPELLISIQQDLISSNPRNDIIAAVFKITGLDQLPTERICSNVSLDVLGQAYTMGPFYQRIIPHQDPLIPFTIQGERLTTNYAQEDIPLKTGTRRSRPTRQEELPSLNFAKLLSFVKLAFPKRSEKTYGSAGAFYDEEVLFCYWAEGEISKGCYWFDRENQTLIRLPGVWNEELADVAREVENGSGEETIRGGFYIMARHQRLFKKYGPLAMRLATLNAGVMLHHAQLSATALDLILTPLGYQPKRRGFMSTMGSEAVPTLFMGMHA